MGCVFPELKLFPPSMVLRNSPSLPFPSSGGNKNFSLGSHFLSFQNGRLTRKRPLQRAGVRPFLFFFPTPQTAYEWLILPESFPSNKLLLFFFFGRHYMSPPSKFAFPLPSFYPLLAMHHSSIQRLSFPPADAPTLFLQHPSSNPNFTQTCSLFLATSTFRDFCRSFSKISLLSFPHVQSGDPSDPPRTTVRRPYNRPGDNIPGLIIPGSPVPLSSPKIPLTFSGVWSRFYPLPCYNI